LCDMLASYSWSDLSGKRVLVVGLGGGCDSIMAYAVAKDMVAPLTKAKVVVYGNTIGDRPLEHHPSLTQYIKTVPPGVPRPIEPEDKGCYHTTKIEQSLPRGPEDSPLLFVIPFTSGSDLDDVFERNKQALLDGIKGLNFDFIFGVDTGGDSLTGGIDWTDHPALGRDRQMLALLTWVGVPMFHLMISPTSDGESSMELMQHYFDLAIAAGFYKGKFECDSIIETCRTFTKPLLPNRTPNIMVSAFDDTLQKVDDKMIVPRGLRPQVPREWLISGYVFCWPSDMKPDYMLESK